MLVLAFKKIGAAFEPFAKADDVAFQSSILNDILFALPAVKGPVECILKDISLIHASNGKKDQMFLDEEKYPNIADNAMVCQRVICYLDFT